MELGYNDHTYKKQVDCYTSNKQIFINTLLVSNNIILFMCFIIIIFNNTYFNTLD